MSDDFTPEIVHGYKIRKSVVFENDRGFALAHNPDAVAPFVTWMFKEDENGVRDYFWGHYIEGGEAAAQDFDLRVSEYRQEYGLAEKPAPESYKYYSTQRPVGIGTFPSIFGCSCEIVNFDRRSLVEHDRFMAWGYIKYSMPLTKKQMDDYELRPAPGNPDRRRMEEQAQVVGKWEQAHRIPDTRRLTWWYPDFGVFIVNESVTPERLAKLHSQIVEAKTRAAEKRAAKKPIAEQLAEAGKQAERDAKISTEQKPSPEAER